MTEETWSYEPQQNEIWNYEPPSLTSSEPSLGQNLLNAITGANRGFARMYGFGPHVEQAEEAYKKASQQSPGFTGTGEFIGDVIASMPHYAAFGPLGGGFSAGLMRRPEEGENRLQNAMVEAILSKVGEKAFQGVGKLFKKAQEPLMRPSHIAEKHGHLIPTQEIAERVQAARGTETPLGDILGSSQLKKQLENKLLPSMGSGAEQKLANLETQILDKTQNVFNRIGSGTPGLDQDTHVKNLIESAFTKQQDAKNLLYKNVSDMAEKTGFQPKLSSFKTLAKDVTKQIDESPLMQSDPALRKLYSKISGIKKPEIDIYSPILSETGEPIFKGTVYPSISEINGLKNRLWNEGNKLQKSLIGNDKYTGNLYKELSARLGDDLKSDIAAFPDKALHEAYTKATENYKKNFSQFLDKDIYKLTSPETSADAIARQIIKPSKTADKTARLKKIQGILPGNQKNALGFAYLQPAIDKYGNLQPKQLDKLLGSLGNKQFKELFPDPALRSELKDLQKLYRLNPEALNRMFNPKTGQRLQQDVNILKTAAKMGVGGYLGNVPGAIAGGIYEPLHAKYATGRLMSEPFREKVLQEILKQQTSHQKIVPDYLSQALTTALGKQGMETFE